MASEEKLVAAERDAAAKLSASREAHLAALTEARDEAANERERHARLVRRPDDLYNHYFCPTATFIYTCTLFLAQACGSGRLYPL